MKKQTATKGLLLVSISFLCAITVQTAGSSESPRTLSAQAKTSTAEEYFGRGNFAKAETLLRKALSDAPDYIRASQLLGYALFRQDRIAEAIPYLKDAGEDRGCENREECLLLLGTCLVKLNRANEAIPYLKTCIKLNPDNQNVYGMLFNAYQKVGNMTESIKTAKEILRRFPKSPQCADLRSWISTLDSESQAQATASVATGSSPLDNYFAETTTSMAARWDTDQMPLQVYIEPAPLNSFWKAEYDTILKKAFETWATASNNSLSFVFTNDASDAKIKCHWTAKSADLAGSFEQGVTRTKHTDHSLKLADVTILTTFPKKGTVPVPTEIISKTCLHEIGHALGLSGHSPNPKDIMYFSEETTGAKVVDLSARDRKTILMLYTLPLIARGMSSTLMLEKRKAEVYTFDEGVNFINRRDFEGAVACFTYILNKTPSSSMARINLGIAYAGLAMQRDQEKRFDEAERYYRHALEIRHEIPDKHTLDAAVKNYAAMLKDLGRTTEAASVENQL